jgi:hypothetical protein
MQNYIKISHSFSPIFPPHYYCGFKTSCQIAFLVTCGYKNKAKMRLKAIAICFFLLGSMAIVKAQEVPTAATVLETAQKQAKKEKKKVCNVSCLVVQLVQKDGKEHAGRCGKKDVRR